MQLMRSLYEEMDMPGKRVELDPIYGQIERALDAGIDVTAAICALDDIDGDPDLEPEEPDGDPYPGDVPVFVRCECGHQHVHETIEVL